MKGLGYGKGYEYAHDLPTGRSDQEHLPPNLRGRIYYEPTEHGFEAHVRKRLAWREERNVRTEASANSQQHREPIEPLAPGEEPQDLPLPEPPPPPSRGRRRA
jgi:putative ATPase